MKSSILKFSFLLIVCGTSYSGFSQSAREIENKQVSAYLTFTENTKTFVNDNVVIKVFTVKFPADTLPKSNSEEVFTRLVISVSETGEYPRYKVYEIPQLYGVSRITFSSVNPDRERIEFTHGQYKQRKIGVFEVNVKSLSLTKIQ